MSEGPVGCIFINTLVKIDVSKLRGKDPSLDWAAPSAK